MKIAFLTEMGFRGKIPHDHPNMRTEFAWMHAMDAEHRDIRYYKDLHDFDHVFIIFPKGRLYLSAEGSKIKNDHNPVSDLLSANIIDHLKSRNKRVYYIQEGPSWWFNDYEIYDQIHFFNLLTQVDAIFCHNESDKSFYQGLVGTNKVHVMRSLMIDDQLKSIQSNIEDKCIIGGNFSRWYGGFQSYMVAQHFELPIWAQTSHSTRDYEDQMVNHLPRLLWKDWMQALSGFKFAVHLMPTVAAGTFSLNCAYFGIPCIGNERVDTQKICHPELSVDVEDVKKAKDLAIKLKRDQSFYNHCSKLATQNYEKYYRIDFFKSEIFSILQQYE